MAATDDTYILRLFFLLVALTAGAAFTFFSARTFLKSSVAKRMPRPALCAVLWSLPPIFIGFAVLLAANNFSNALDFLLFIPIAALLGVLFGSCFVLLTRFGIGTGSWQQRLVVGAIIGLALAFVIGFGMHQIFTGWGGPGGGNFRRPEVLEVSLFFSWLIPVFGLIGAATPRQATMPNLRLNPDLASPSRSA